MRQPAPATASPCLDWRTDMLDLDYYAMKLQHAREDTVYRKAALLGPFDSELERERQRQRRAMPNPVRWAGAGLAAMGRRLTAMGERLAPPPHADPAQPIA